MWFVRNHSTLRTPSGRLDGPSIVVEILQRVFGAGHNLRIVSLVGLSFDTLLNCLDGARGQTVWSVNILDDNQAENNEHGVCGSPLVVDNRVIVSPTGVFAVLSAPKKPLPAWTASV